MTQRQIEAARRTIVRYVKRKGKMWVRVFPDKPVTKKAAETRMGKGKGAVDHYVAVIKPGRIILEIGGLEEDQAREALRLAAYKLPIKTQIIGRRDLTASASTEEKQHEDQRSPCARSERDSSTSSTSLTRNYSTCVSSGKPASWSTTTGFRPCAAISPA